MYADSIARPRFNTILLGCFAGLALILAIVGVYGVIAMTMNQRLREIGVRMALGAGAADVKLLTLRWGIRPVIIGVFAGAGASLALARVVESQLFEVSSVDPVTYAVVAIVMLLVGVVATFVPARRAARVDPATTLRFE